MDEQEPGRRHLPDCAADLVIGKFTRPTAINRRSATCVLMIWLAILTILLLSQASRLVPSLDFSSLLQSNNCTSACLLGLSPGETRLDDAIAHLQAHPWVRAIVVSSELQRSGTGYFFLQWTGAQPDVINDHLVASVWIEDRLVKLIRLPLATALGSLARHYAPLESAEFVRLSQASSMAEVPLWPDSVARVTVRCPTRRSQIWWEPPELRIGATTNLWTTTTSDGPMPRPCQE